MGAVSCAVKGAAWLHHPAQTHVGYRGEQEKKGWRFGSADEFLGLSAVV